MLVKETLIFTFDFTLESGLSFALIVERVFTDKGNMKIHIRLHTREKPYTCLQCGKTFTYQRDLKRHSHIHSELILRFSEWGKTFADKINFSNHLHIHPGERLFNCDRCNTKFPFKSHLEIHMKSHTDAEILFVFFVWKGF